MRLQGSGASAHESGTLYRFPFAEQYLCGQSIGGAFSHSDAATFHSVDFMMPVGTAVLAARSGTVLAVKSDETNGGPEESLRNRANFVW